MTTRIVRSDISPFDAVVQRLRSRSFAVLGTSDEQARPHAAGVEYAMSRRGTSVFVMTRRHLRKARNIASNPHVSVVVPLTRRILWFLPPPCIQFDGIAEVVDRTDTEGLESFRSFLVGRKILRMYDEFERRGESRVCFIRIGFGSRISTYGVGTSIWSLIRRMEGGLKNIEVPSSYRTSS